MNFNKHTDLEGKHAILSASKYHWIRYDSRKMSEVYYGYFAAEEGTRLHALAAECIRMKQKLMKKKKTVNMYVNDAIDISMKPEQVLYYSKNCFGTADAINFENGVLHIYDLKSGVTPVHEEQLYIYAALFCLEYGAQPEEIQMDLRIYQNDTVSMFAPEPGVIREIMKKIVEFDELIEDIRSKEAEA